MTEEVKFIRGNSRISQLAQRPDIAADVAEIRAGMAEADRTYAMGLAALRQAADLTQVELARRLGVTQAAISRIEQPHDLLLSTLNSYLQAIGGTARMVVRFADGHEATLDLGHLALRTTGPIRQPDATDTAASPGPGPWYGSRQLGPDLIKRSSSPRCGREAGAWRADPSVPDCAISQVVREIPHSCLIVARQ